jgi:hypothetical protein
MAGFMEPPQTTDPVELLRYFQKEAKRRETPKAELPKGILERPTEEVDDKSYGVMKFFADWWSGTEDKVSEARKEVLEGLVNMPTPRLPQPPVPDELMDLPTAESEPVLEGAPEMPEMGSREPFELEVDTIGNEALDRNGMRLVDVTDTEQGKLSNEEALFEMGKQIREETIETKGIMSKPDDDSADGVQPTRGKELLDFIGEGEGTYDSANRGTINGKIQGAEISAKRDGKLVSEMTVSEIRKYQAITDPKDKNRLFTVGKYQTTPDTFEEAVKALGISEDTVFSSDVQDKVGVYLVSKKRPRLGKYLKGDDNISTDRAMLDLAMEFASVPVPYSIKKGTYGSWPKVDLVAGDTFYKDKAKGGNKALHTVDETRDMLKATFGVLK